MFGKPRPRKQPFAVRAYSDGPLRARPPEDIRYAIGKCPVGHLLVAVSDEGIVTIMIRARAGQLLPELRPRFPKAVLSRDEKSVGPVLAKVAKYVAAPYERFALPLDIRGTALQLRIWDEIRKFPFGQTSTYSKIAEAIGSPKAIRAVASTCSRSWLAFAVPCHRVLHKGADPAQHSRKGSVQYRWVDYEAGLTKPKRKASTA